MSGHPDRVTELERRLFEGKAGHGRSYLLSGCSVMAKKTHAGDDAVGST